MYDFHKSKKSNHEHYFWHPYFIRDDPESLLQIKRKKHDELKDAKDQTTEHEEVPYPKPFTNNRLMIESGEELFSANKKTKDVIGAVTDTMISLMNRVSDLEARIEKVEQVNKECSSQNTMLLNELVKTKEKEQNLERYILIMFGYLASNGFSMNNPKEISQNDSENKQGNTSNVDTVGPLGSQVVLKNEFSPNELQNWLKKLMTEMSHNFFIPQGTDINSQTNLDSNMSPFLSCMNGIMGKFNNIKNAAQTTTSSVVHKPAQQQLTMLGNGSPSGAKVEQIDSLSDSSLNGSKLIHHNSTDSESNFLNDVKSYMDSNQKKENTPKRSSYPNYLQQIPSSFSPSSSRKDSGQFDFLRSTPERFPSSPPYGDQLHLDDNEQIPSPFTWNNNFSRNNSTASLFHLNDTINPLSAEEFGAINSDGDKSSMIFSPTANKSFGALGLPFSSIPPNNIHEDIISPRSDLSQDQLKGIQDIQMHENVGMDPPTSMEDTLIEMPMKRETN